MSNSHSRSAMLTAQDGLLIVDVQRDFCPGGALPVPEGDAVIAPLNGWIKRFLTAQPQPHIYASRDWHPAQSRHFRPIGLWPPHCVQNTPGAEFQPGLRWSAATAVISKGTTPQEDGYSAFEGRDEAGSPLAERLRRDGIRRLFIGGLATDYCVRATALAARREGLEVVLLNDAVRAVDVHAGDGAKAMDELRAAGVIIE